jgi:hypothetical protein
MYEEYRIFIERYATGAVTRNDVDLFHELINNNRIFRTHVGHIAWRYEQQAAREVNEARQAGAPGGRAGEAARRAARRLRVEVRQAAT